MADVGEQYSYMTLYLVNLRVAAPGFLHDTRVVHPIDLLSIVT
jgi:hypothetical protein